MQTTALYKTLGLALCAAFISACSSTGDVEEGTSEATATETQAEENTQTVDTAGVDGESLEAEAADAQAALLEQTVFYFDFDESSIKSEGKAALMAHAGYLAANPAAQVVRRVCLPCFAQVMKFVSLCLRFVLTIFGN